jgi:hypothetical protein
MGRSNDGNNSPLGDGEDVRNIASDAWAAFERAVDAVVKAPPQPHSTAPKPTSTKGEAQRRRRAQERQQPAERHD